MKTAVDSSKNEKKKTVKVIWNKSEKSAQGESEEITSVSFLTAEWKNASVAVTLSCKYSVL